MEKVTFTCETVTPLFLAGADGTTPELRAPSIKGALRFWWRAMNGHLSLDELRKQEGEIFGGTDEKQGRSKVLIRVIPKILTSDYSPLLPHKTGRERGDKLAFKKGQSFEIQLCLTQVIPGFDIEKLKALFILTCVLGGFGKRARRGMGSVKVTEVASKPYSCETIEKIYNLVRKLNVSYRFNKSANEIKFSFKEQHRYPYVRVIQLGTKSCSVLEIAQATHDIKRANLQDYGKSMGYAERNQRFASPIFVSLLEINNQLVPIITTLATQSPKGKPIFAIQEEFIKEVLS